MLRHRYPISPFIHLISIGLWIALLILLASVLMGLLCRRRMRMFRRYGYYGHQAHGHGHCRCHGQERGHGHGHGHCRCHGQERGHSHDYDYGHYNPPSHIDALEILRQRYARGEIDDATFEHMRERLGPSPAFERPPEGE